MNAITLLTLSLSLIAFSPLQADDFLETTLLLEEDVAVITPTFSIEEEIDQPFVINFKTLQAPLAEEDEDVEMYMPFSEKEIAPQTLETPIIFPVETQEIAFQSTNDTHHLVQTSSLPAPVAPLSRMEPTSSSAINMREVFQGAPFIYSLLLAISIGAFALWFYTLLNMRTEKLMPRTVIDGMQENLKERRTKEALDICRVNPSLLSSMLHSGLLIYQGASTREMIESMQSEGKRVSSSLWQKLGLLNDVAIVAPMIGLLGTVVGMFYAFYDINRSVESMNALFDGLGISVGTTVAGLILAILALGLHSMSKYRLVKQLTKVESTAHKLISISKLGMDREEEQKEQTP